jgi:hypothetical protein
MNARTISGAEPVFTNQKNGNAKAAENSAPAK